MDTDANSLENLTRITTGIYRLSAVLSRSSEDVLQQSCGFGVSQFRILWVLHTHQEGVQQNAIAKWMNLTEAAVSRQLKLMQEKGLLSVDVDPEDRRSRNVSLTPEGREFTQAGITRIIEQQAPAFAVLSETEQVALLQMLDKVFYRACDTLDK